MTDLSDAELQAMQDCLRAAQPKAKEVKPVSAPLGPWAASLKRRLDSLPRQPVPVPDARAEKLKALAIHRRAIDDGMIAAGVPTLYRCWGLAIDFHGVLPNGADWGRRGYCLRGPTGNRKSSLAGALVRDRLRQMDEPSGLRMMWVSMLLFMERIKSASQNNSRETGYDILRRMKELDLLVIDDLGRERNHDWDRTVMSTMLWTAWDWGANFIITTQQQLAEIDSLDTALASRLGTLAEVDLGIKDWR